MNEHTPLLISVEEARALYPEAGGAHGFSHVLRVLRLAEHIGQVEGADMLVLRTACLLHDIGRPAEASTGICHAQWGAERARQLLAGRPPELVEAVAHAIAAHRFRSNVEPRTLEAKVLSDADKLDALGAIGVARAYAVAGERGSDLWGPMETAQREGDAGGKGHTPVHEFLYKLSRLPEHMYTPTGRRIAEHRLRFMQAFFEELEAEVHGEH
ncbi:MAG: HD domain-containing protein [Anaerolineae bacterium]